MTAPAAKTCSKCGTTKPLSEFRARKGSRDGLHGWCHPCYNGYYSKASREWRAANRERARASAQALYWKAPERARERKRQHDAANRALVNERARAWYRAHRETAMERARQYREENRDAMRERQRMRYAANPGFYRARAERRAVLGRAKDDDVAQWCAVLVRQRCGYCGAADRVEIDHVVPLAQGGTHSIDNVIPACLPCNRSKGAKSLLFWTGGL